MKVIQISESEADAVTNAVEILKAGNVILYPTDTLYGLGADAFSDEAVDKVYEIKGRDAKKPMHAIFADMEMVEQFAEVNDIAKKLAEKFLPGALTMILKKKPGVTGGIARDMETIGVRIPNNSFCTETARAFGKPFTATSANVTGQDAVQSVDEVLTQFADAQIGIELAIDAGTLAHRVPSTVVDVSSGELRILREGMIPAAEIQSAL
jgi:L-threonylcarbamoyladenylate synthase